MALTGPFILKDVVGGLWQVSVAANGWLTTKSVTSGTATTVILIDQGTGTFLLLGVDTLGNLTTTPTTLATTGAVFSYVLMLSPTNFYWKLFASSGFLNTLFYGSANIIQPIINKGKIWKGHQ